MNQKSKNSTASFLFLLTFVAISGISQLFVYLLVLVSFYYILFGTRKLLDLDLIILLVFSLSYDLALNTGGPVGRTFNVLYPVAFYIIGKTIFNNIPNSYRINNLLITFIILFTLIPTISFLLNIIKYGFYFSSLKLLGTDSEYTALTNFTSYFALSISLFPLIFYKSNDKHLLINKRISVILALVAIFIIGSIGQRTGFFILIFSTVAYLLLLNFKQLLNLSLKSMVFGTFAFIAFHLITWDWLYETTIYNRLFVAEAEKGVLHTRSDIWGFAIKEFISNPSGNKSFYQLEGGYMYAHNLWLDVGIRAGYLVLLPLIILSILYISKLYKILKSPLQLYAKMLFTFISIAIFSTFMVEPIMQGYLHFFCAFAFIFGVVNRVIIAVNLKETNK